MFQFKTFARLVFVCVFSFQNLYAQVPEYYDSINFEIGGADLQSQLSSLITNTHTTFIPYTSSWTTDTWDILRISDLEFESSTNVLLIYGYNDNDGTFISDRSRDAFDTCHSSSCIGLWNREHVFAKSLANPSLTTSDPGPGTDVHNLRSADSQKNSQRSNRLFIDSSGNSKVLGEYFYPGDEWKGDVARIIMYMYLRYPSQCEPVNSATGPMTYAANNDMPDIFLEWNDQDPVSDLEITRNDVISSYQGNRNPFIDNPYLATMIWGGPDAEDTWGVLSLQTPKQNDFEIQLNVSHGLIEVNGLNSEPYTITVFNMLGQEILQQKNSKTIRVSSLGKGIYILKVEQSGQQAALKFSVQK